MDNSKARGRFAHIDDARSLVIFIVVLVHASVTYSGIGGWYVVENRGKALGAASYAIMGLFNSFNQAWFMGIMFFFGGYFAREALARKGALSFIRDRTARLGIPLFAFMFIVTPFLMYYLINPTIYQPMGSFASLYVTRYLGELMFIGASGPLWFAATLLVFSLALVATVAIRGRLTRRVGNSGRAPSTRAIFALIGVIAAIAFAIRVFLPIGTSFFNYQFCFFASYVALFALGSLGYSRGWFAALTSCKGSRWLTAALCVGIPLWVIICVAGGALTGDMGSISGGLTWQSAAYCVWESFTAVAMSLGLTAVLANRSRQGGAVSSFLARNSFSVYFFHPVFLIALTRLLHEWALPPPLKALTVGMLAYLATLSFSALVVRRIPWVKKYF